MATRAKSGLPQKVSGTSALSGASKKRSRQQSERDAGSSAQTEPTRKYVGTAIPFSVLADWDDDMHRNLVSAIFEIGMRNSSPAVILENMIDRPGAITSERVKSKLQKFRNSKDKATQEFMEEYDSFLAKLQAVGSAGLGNQQDLVSPAAILKMMGCRKLVGGDAAALVSYVSMSEDTISATASAANAGVPLPKKSKGTTSSQLLRKNAIEYIEDFAGAEIPFPKLSDEERNSPLGLSLFQVKELFQSMRHQVMANRGIAQRD